MIRLILFVSISGFVLPSPARSYLSESIWDLHPPPKIPHKKIILGNYVTPTETMVELTNRLGMTILKDHSSFKKNFAFSPYGLVSVLVILFEAAGGESAWQISRALNFPPNKEIVRKGFRDMQQHLRTYFSHEEFLSGVTLNKKTSDINPDFTKALNYYGYSINLKNFEDYKKIVIGHNPNQKLNFIPVNNLKHFRNSERTNDSEMSSSEEDETEDKSSEESETAFPDESEEDFDSSELNENQNSEDDDESQITTSKPGKSKRVKPASQKRSNFAKPSVSDGESSEDSSGCDGSVKSSTVTESEKNKDETSTTMPKSSVTASYSHSEFTTTSGTLTSDEMAQTHAPPTTTSKSFNTESTGTNMEEKSEGTTSKSAITGASTVMEEIVTSKGRKVIEGKIDKLKGTKHVSRLAEYPDDEGLTTASDSTEETVTEEMDYISSISTTLSKALNEEAKGTDKREAEGTTGQAFTQKEDESEETEETDKCSDGTEESCKNEPGKELKTPKTLAFEVLANPKKKTRQESRNRNKPLKFRSGSESMETTTDSEKPPALDGAWRDYMNKVLNSEFFKGYANNGGRGFRSSRCKRNVLDSFRQLYGPKPKRHLPNGMQDPNKYNIGRAYRDPTRQMFLVDGLVDTSVPVMTYTNWFPFGYIPQLYAKALEFPLDDTRYKLLIVLPIERRGLRQLIYDLDSFSVTNILKSLKLTNVRAIFPSFMMKGFVTITHSLQKLGIQDLFNPLKANLSGMSNDPELFVRNIQQSVSVVIRNSRDGSGMQTDTMETYFQEEFIATHPFAYFILDNKTNVTLMIGQMFDPLNSKVF